MLGMKLLELRKENNISQEELAKRLGVARQTISQWELEKTYPDIKQAKRIAELFNISIDMLASNDFVDTNNINSMKNDIIEFLDNKLDEYRKKTIWYKNWLSIVILIFQVIILIIQIILLI